MFLEISRNLQKENKCQSLSFNKAAGLLKKRLFLHSCFPVNFAKFLRTPFFTEHSWWLLLKVCKRYFLSNFYFSPNDSPLKNYEKCFLFHLKSFFRSRDIHVIVFSSSPLFLPVSHCFRSWSRKNLKVCNLINCLNRNLIKHFVWHLEKEIRCDIESLSIDRVLNKEHFNRKIMQKMCIKS